MKSLYISIIILIIIIIFSFASFFVAQSKGEYFISLLNTIETNAKEDNKNESIKRIENLKEEWKNSEIFLTSMTRHEILDTIDIQISSLIPLIENNEMGHFYSQISILKTLIEKMSEDESPVFQNLF